MRGIPFGDGCRSVSSGTSTTTAPGATLFMLDDEGILYSERRGELETLDSAAAFVWCCLEEEYPLEGIVCDLAEAFGIPMTAARDRVDTLTRKWGDRGDISVNGNAPGRIHLTTALGRLLADEALRRAFAASPRKLADALQIRSADRDTFLALDPRCARAPGPAFDGQARVRCAQEPTIGADRCALRGECRRRVPRLQDP